MVYDCIGTHPSEWAGKPYPAIREIGEQDGSILVVPIGSLEQHGYHMPVSTDTLLVDAMAKLGADRVREDVPILVTPPVWTGYSPHHLPFGGTITLEYNTLLNMLEDVADSALENGFDSILILNGHGGNGALVSSATSTIGRHYPNVEVNALTYFELASTFIDDIRESDVGGMNHAGEFETSLMLYLRPELVHTDKLDGDYKDEPYEWGGQDLMVDGSLTTYRPFTEYSDSGAIGDPGLASAEKGEAIYDLLGDELEALLRQMQELNQ